MKTRIIIATLLLISFGASAQTTKKELFKDTNRLGANYLAYPGPTQKALTPAPEGYEPFYISHFGRHGSRYMTENDYYILAINKLDSAAQFGILSQKGAKVLETLKKGYDNAYKRDGDLTALGGLQHRQIAHRMYDRFPSLLSQPLKVDAKSSTVGRCMISMFNFCNELQGLNPTLDIRMDASKSDWKYIVHNDDVKPKKTELTKELSDKVEAITESMSTKRYMKSLFTDLAKAEEFIDGYKLAEALYNIASDLQNVPEQGLSLADVFTKEELFCIWQFYNAGWLLECGLIPGSTPKYEHQRLIRDSIETIACKVIRGGKPTLSLRFSHDGSILPLTYLMGIKEAMGGTQDIKNLYKHISIDKLIPMAANLQLVFYLKDGSDDILVKFLLNENETSIPAVKTDVAPYYHWEDVKAYWKTR